MFCCVFGVWFCVCTVSAVKALIAETLHFALFAVGLGPFEAISCKRSYVGGFFCLFFQI